MRRKRGAGRDVGRRLEHLTHINERLLSAFYVAMREQFAAGKFAPRGMTTQKPCRPTTVNVDIIFDADALPRDDTADTFQCARRGCDCFFFFFFFFIFFLQRAKSR